MRKIDENGNFQPFAGITVVSSMFGSNQLLCAALYRYLSESKILAQYYSLLPYDSYHMTAFSVCNQLWDGGGDWEGYIQKKLLDFQRLDSALKNRPFFSNITVTHLTISGAIQLVVELPKEQENVIHTIANRFGLSHQVPSEFHITLGYQYRQHGKDVADVIMAEIMGGIGQVINNHPLNPIASPQLCYFADMTAFIPWDGKCNPFSTTLRVIDPPITPSTVISPGKRSTSSPNFFNRGSPDFPRLGGSVLPDMSNPRTYVASPVL